MTDESFLQTAVKETYITLYTILPCISPFTWFTILTSKWTILHFKLHFELLKWYCPVHICFIKSVDPVMCDLKKVAAMLCFAQANLQGSRFSKMNRGRRAQYNFILYVDWWKEWESDEIPYLFAQRLPALTGRRTEWMKRVESFISNGRKAK